MQYLFVGVLGQNAILANLYKHMISADKYNFKKVYKSEIIVRQQLIPRFQGGISANAFSLFCPPHWLFTPMEHGWSILLGLQNNASNPKILSLAYRCCIHQQISVYYLSSETPVLHFTEADSIPKQALKDLWMQSQILNLQLNYPNHPCWLEKHCAKMSLKAIGKTFKCKMEEITLNKQANKM